MTKITVQQQIEKLEALMNSADFWNDKDQAKETIRTLKELKDKRDGDLKYDKGSATLTILAGAGGDDAEDFVRMLFEMYTKYSENNTLEVRVIHEHENTLGGYRNVTIEISGKDVYGKLKNESGVHRLVRTSPFNSKGLRHTSFAMVEVMPIIPMREIEIRPDDLRIELSKSGGPGGQNVNKRETAVRIVHIPTNISASASNERSQEQNKQKAMEMLGSRIFKLEQDNHKAEIEGRQISKTVEIEWGSQIRSYVLHPYKMIKDHRTGAETSDVENVLGGDISIFIEAEVGL